MSPHTIYYGKPPTASYSALLGDAYKKARTEYGLRLAKHLLLQIKQTKPNMVIPQSIMEQWVSIGDGVWSSTTDDPDVDCEELLVVAFHECLVEAGITLEQGMEVVEDKDDCDSVTSNLAADGVDMQVDEVDLNPFWDNEDNNITSFAVAAQATDYDGATSTFGRETSLFTEEESSLATLHGAKADLASDTCGEAVTLGTEDVGTAPLLVEEESRRATLHLSVATPAIETTGETVPLVAEEESSRTTLHEAVAAETNAGTVPVVTKEDPRGELPDVNNNSDANLGEVDSINANLREVDNDEAILTSNVEDPVTAEATNGLILASDDSTCDTLEKILNTKYTDELGTTDTRAVMPTVEYCQTPYRHGYVVKLPKTIDGFMISIGVSFDESPLLESYYLAFAMYLRHKGDIISRAEDLRVMKNVGDVLAAIDGQDLSGKKMAEVLEIVAGKQVGDIMELTFVDRVGFNEHSYKRLRTGNVTPNKTVKDVTSLL